MQLFPAPGHLLGGHSVRSPKEGQDVTPNHQPPWPGVQLCWGTNRITTSKEHRRPPIALGEGPRSSVGRRGVPGKGLRCLQRGFGEQLKCQNNHHSTVAPDKSRFVSFLFISSCLCPLPAHPPPLPSQNLCSFWGCLFFGFFFFISVNILNCKCCLVMTIAYCFGRCFFTMHTNILWLLYMNIFNDT